ncbi:hypothetical protein ACLOJK_031662 [Asimina triloba]
MAVGQRKKERAFLLDIAPNLGVWQAMSIRTEKEAREESIDDRWPSGHSSVCASHFHSSSLVVRAAASFHSAIAIAGSPSSFHNASASAIFLFLPPSPLSNHFSSRLILFLPPSPLPSDS